MDNLLNDKLDMFLMSASKNHDTFRVGVIRDIKTEFTAWKTAKANIGKKFDEKVETDILTSMVNKRRKNIEKMNEDISKGFVTTEESLARVKEAQDEENRQIAIIQEYLPKEPTEDEILNAFKQIRDTEGVEPVKSNMGTFMKRIKECLPGVNGKLASTIVSNNIQ